MQVNTEDITVPWGQQPDPLDHQNGKWRLAVFQDMQESLDSNKLYFLYDPVADDTCITTWDFSGICGLRTSEIPLRFEGKQNLRNNRVRVCRIPLKSSSPAGGTAFALVTSSEDYGQYTMHVWRVNLNADGTSLMADPHSVLQAPLAIDSEYICVMREDAPELVVMFGGGGGLHVVRVNADATAPQDPLDRFVVQGAELSHFYDGFVSRGPDGHFDNSRVHVLSLASRGSLSTQYLQADPQRGFPPPRKQAALDSIAGFILLAGGEIDYGEGDVNRLVDYWALDLTTNKWNQVPASMPVPLIEPRLTTANSGNVYVWGDFDEPLPGMPPQGTHVRILRIRGFNALSPPPYNQAVGGSYAAGPQPYPQAPSSSGGYYGGGGGGAQQGYLPPSGGYGQPQAGYGQPQGGYGQGYGQEQQYPHYPEGEKKKDCVIS